MTGLPEFAPWDLPGGGASITVPEGCVLAVHSVFCGKDAGVTLHVGAAVAQRLGGEVAGLLTS